MSRASAGIVEQAQSLVAAARLLPADEAARVLEQVSLIAQAAQTEVLAAAERSGEIKDSGCRTVRSFASTILRRSVDDAAALAKLAHHLTAFPQLAAAYSAGLVPTGNMRVLMKQIKAVGLGVLQANEDALVTVCTQAGPGQVKQLCDYLADLHQPDRDQAKVRAQGARLVRIHPLGDLGHLDAMIDPVLADRLKSTLAMMVKQARTPDDPRGHAERSADALEDILRRGMDHHDCGHAPPRGRPHASVSVQLETLQGMGARGPALLARFGIIPRSTAARVACDAVV